MILIRCQQRQRTQKAHRYNESDGRLSDSRAIPGRWSCPAIPGRFSFTPRVSWGKITAQENGFPRPGRLPGRG